MPKCAPSLDVRHAYEVPQELSSSAPLAITVVWLSVLFLWCYDIIHHPPHLGVPSISKLSLQLALGSRASCVLVGGVSDCQKRHIIVSSGSLLCASAMSLLGIAGRVEVASIDRTDTIIWSGRAIPGFHTTLDQTPQVPRETSVYIPAQRRVPHVLQLTHHHGQSFYWVHQHSH